MAIFRYRVYEPAIQKARDEYFRLNGITIGNIYKTADEAKFREAVGITDEQWDNFDETWTLSVSLTTAKKLELLASGNTQHWETMFKIIEARHGR